MKYPKRIEIGAYEFMVSQTENLYQDSAAPAEVSFRKETVEIEKAQSPIQKDFLLLHELIHIIENVYSLNLDEHTINRLANGFLEFQHKTLGIKFEWEE